MTAAVKKLPSMIRPEVQFFDHQVEGVRWMLKAGNALLADEMGLGKSLQALTVAAFDYDRGADTIVVVTLATLKGNWLEEIRQHTFFDVEVLTGTPRQREKQLGLWRTDKTGILIVNYEQVVAHWEDLNALEPDVVIYDEAHALKNRRSQRTKACLKLTGKRQIVVTGSPMLNHVDELWTLLHRLDPEGYPKYWTFRQRYVVYGGFQGKQIVGVKNERELNRKLATVMLRRLKKDVLDLPDKQYVKVWLDLTAPQRKLYDEAFHEQTITLPDDPTPLQLENALVKFLRLKEICGSAGTIEGYDDVSVKLDRAVELIAEAVDGGEPIVVLTQFRSILRFLGERLSKASIPWWELHGDVPQAERVPTIRAWSDAAKYGEPGAMCCMFQVGGVGLNMTAASKIILLDKLYVPKLNEQAVDRVHRIGVSDTKPVQIFELLCRKTIEQRIERILSGKDKTFDAVVEGDTAAFKRALVAAMREEDE